MGLGTDRRVEARSERDRAGWVEQKTRDYLPRRNRRSSEPSGNKAPPASVKPPASIEPPKARTRPEGESRRERREMSPASMRTARSVTTSTEPDAGNSSNRHVATAVADRLSWRTTSRRNAPFLSLDSTMVSDPARQTILRGIAGEPLPEPRSNHVRGDASTRVVARIGSTRSLSIASLERGGPRGMAVKFTRRFQ